MGNRLNPPGLFCSSLFFLSTCLFTLAIAHGWKAPEESAQIKNPITINKMTIEAGQQIYNNFCSACHGDTAEGGGRLDLDIQPVPPDLKTRLKDHSDGDFFWKVKNGRGNMPAFNEDLEDKGIWYLVTFIRSLIE